jgi:gliding motility-associated-like protein
VVLFSIANSKVSPIKLNTIVLIRKSILARHKRWLSMLGLMFIGFGSQAQYQINGNAAQTACNCWRLTPANNSQNGSVWNVNLFDLSNPFNFTFDVYLGCNDGGADGMAFVLQPLSVNAGSSGGGIGYAGINPSFAVEMDTYVNATDPGVDHMAFQTNGIVTHGGTNTLAGPVQTSAASGNVEDCAWHVLNINWDPITMIMNAYFDGVLRLTYTGDIINNLFGGNPNVYWGFTAATGGANNLHQFCNSLSPAFIVTSPVQCQGFPVDFESASVVATGLITDYQWDFGDGNTATGTQVSHTYATSGNYNVTLTITSEGCTESSMVQVTINPEPTVDLGLDQAICDGDAYQMAPVGLTGGEQLLWNPPLGLDNPAISNPIATPLVTTVYTLGVLDANGCTNSDYIEIVVNPLPVAEAGADQTICDGDVTNMAAAGGGQYLWDPVTDLIDPTSATSAASPSATTIYTVTVTDANGCVDTDDMTITVNVVPVVIAGVNVSICDQQTTQLTANGAANYNWNPVADLSNALIFNPVFSGNSTTIYTVTGSNINGCSSTDDVEITVFPLPVADFVQPPDVCLGNPSVFTDNSTGNGLIHAWNFGDGAPADNSVSPDHTYTTDGAFAVTLNLTDANGCMASATANAMVLPMPNAIMNITDGQSFCEDEIIQFGSQSTGGVLDLYWNFGDNNFLPAFPNTTSTLPNPTISYSNFAFGPYTVILGVTDAAGCYDQTQVLITIHDNPNAGFGSSIVCDGNQTQFTDESSVFVSTIDTWAWSFGDGPSASPDQNPMYLYSDSGTFSVQLDVVTDDGCAGSITQDVLVNPTPEIAFTGIDTCLNDETEFVNNSSPQDNTITGWDWDFGDATIVNGVDVAHTYLNHGNYVVSLTATTDSGCFASATINIQVFPNPEPDFNVVEAVGCVPHEVFFVDQSTLAAGFLDTYSWEFGDGGSSTNGNPVYTYQDSGFFDVTLSVTSTEGCNTVLQIADAVRANITPIADFSIKEETLSLLDANAEFEDESQHELLWNWNLGDGTLSSVQNPIHTYTDPGTFDIALTVTNGDCQDVAFGQVFVESIATFYIPSAFSPNDDGINETFFGIGESVKAYNMKITDRWGMQLFESNDPSFHWDGTYQGKPVELGVYVYDFTILSIYGTTTQYTGRVTLAR